MSPPTNGTFPQTSREAAALYLSIGLAPVPVRIRSKKPFDLNANAFLDGWESLQVNTNTLDRYFPPGKSCNIAALNGTASGNHVDADLDCLEALLAAPLLLPPTGWIFGRKTAKGSHRIYKVDRPLKTAQREYLDQDKKCLLELRGDNGMTVYPPSLHEDTGELISWEQFDSPGEVSLAELIRCMDTLAAAVLLARHWPAEGSRDRAAMALSGALVRAKWAEEKISRFVEAVAVAAGDEESRMRAGKAPGASRKIDEGKKVTGWPTLAELLGDHGKVIVQRVQVFLGVVKSPAKKKVRSLAPFKPFPLEALPEPIREFVRQHAKVFGIDPSYVALPALAAVGSLIGTTRTIKLRRGWAEFAIIWSAIVGDSGTLKSPAFLVAVAYLYRLQKQMKKEFKKALAQYQTDLADYKERKKQSKEDGSDPGDAPEPPVLKRVVCSDITIEKLAQILEDNPRGVLVARDELAAWLASFTRYKSSGGTDLPNWLEMHRAGTVILDRKTGDRPQLFIPQAAVSVTGSIQPGVLARALTPEFLDSGFAARILFAMPPKLPKRWTEMEVDPDIEQAYHDLLDKLLLLDFKDDVDGEKLAHSLPLSKDAKAIWAKFYDEWGEEQASAEGEVAAALSKLEGYAARFALLHHVVAHVGLDSDDIREVGPRSIEAGITLCRWFAEEARRIYSTLTESNEERDARRLLEWIRSKGGRTTVKQLQRSNDKKYPTTEAATSVLETLVVAGFGTWEDRPVSGKGGRPTREFLLSQTPPDETDETYPDDGDSGPISPPKTPEPPSDETSDDTCKTPLKPVDFGVSSVSSGGFCKSTDQKNGQNSLSGAEEVSSDAVGGFVGHGEVSSDNPLQKTKPPFSPLKARGNSLPYVLVDSASGIGMVANAIDNSALIGLDLETTGLDPRTDRIRLISLSCETTGEDRITYLVDADEVDPSPLWDGLAEKELVIHNAAFDLGFLARFSRHGSKGFVPGATVHDTMILSQLLTAGTFDKNGLADCVQRELGRALDKAQQKSNWGGELSDGQLLYAAEDVEVLVPLYRALAKKIAAAGLGEVAKIESRCLPALVWLAGEGVPVDRDRWEQLWKDAELEAKRLQEELDKIAPQKPGNLYAESWNWNSQPQLLEIFTLAGCPIKDTSDETLATVDHPIAVLLRQYKAARKHTSSFGKDWARDHIAINSRVYASWRQIGAASGRMSCTDPNMQQLPRGEHRKCIASFPGRVLVKADYSQIELRIAAKVAGDKAMLEAYQHGEDLHIKTARSVLGIQDVTKEHRQLAKALNFGLLFGMGANGFRLYAKNNYGVNLTEAEAGRYRQAFFQSYPDLAAWHNKVRSRRTTETRTLAGRRRLLQDKTPDTHRLNTPIQGSGADGLKIALALLWERRAEAPGAFPVLAVHDEIVIETDEDQAHSVAVWLKQAMVDAMTPLIHPVPVEVEVKIAQTWEGD